MSVSIPIQQQLKFLKQIQQILHSGSFSSTYKFALLMSLSRLAIEQGKDTGKNLTLNYLDIAEKFIDLYWRSRLSHFILMEMNHSCYNRIMVSKQELLA